MMIELVSSLRSRPEDTGFSDAEYEGGVLVMGVREKEEVKCHHLDQCWMLRKRTTHLLCFSNG